MNFECSLYDPLKCDFIVFKTNTISVKKKHTADTDTVNDIMCTCQRVITRVAGLQIRRSDKGNSEIIFLISQRKHTL